MNQNRRRVMKQVITLAAAGAAGLPLVAGAAAPTVINYGGSAWLGHYSAYIAMKTGLMTKHGIDLRWQAFSTSSARMAAVMATSTSPVPAWSRRWLSWPAAPVSSS